ncbi:hypothetical protein JDV02_002083 [Purpureocillium takamizusanense]|uniref:Uncharacterized protein n=1 Tax=Purpureocillium takamizusanense TaxID=2060973 RepID=A0A9Q8V7C4_9HYPO|nr:uncharacterized protein JDV02_002083 [Purpureocillium takamizusanense]UNI15558.1 hypothetical protein JDV02_002083 [Purpureocillium takamizusanense]
MARTYNIDKSLFKHHFRIAPTAQPPAPPSSPLDSGLYAPIAVIANSRTIPFIALHAGPDASPSTPVIAMSHLPAFSTHFKLGLVPQPVTSAGGAKSDSSADTVWEELHMDTSNGSRHSWSMVLLPDDGEGGGGQGDGRRALHRRTFVWKRTHAVAVDGMQIAPLSTRNWKLVEKLDADDALGGADRRDSAGEAHEDKTNPVLAVFTTSTKRGRCGVLQINVNYGGQFDTILLLALLTLYCSGR